MYLTTGNHSKYVIIADAPVPEDVYRGRLFVSSKLIPETLHKAGVSFFNVTVSSLLAKPLDYKLRHLEHMTTVKKHGKDKGWIPAEGGAFVSPALMQAREDALNFLDELRPDCVLLVGELALWAVTGHTKIQQCRGSIYPSLPTNSNNVHKTVCTLSMRDLNIAQDMSVFVERDVQRFLVEGQRGRNLPENKYQFILQASFDTYCQQLDALYDMCESAPTRLAVDIETIRCQVACVGIAWSKHDCVVIPIRTGDEFWTVDQEIALIQKMTRLFHHKNARIVGQNFHYDAMFFASKYGIAPRCTDDTMVASHILFVELPKGLHVLASVYADNYEYWKDEVDDYDKAPENDHKFFAYNAKDCCYTYEIMERLDELLERQPHLKALYRERMDELWPTLLRMMLRGIPVDEYSRSRLARYEVTHGTDASGMPFVRQELVGELVNAAKARHEFVEYVIGREFNSKSSVQMKEFFYNEMGVKPVKSRTNKEADSLNAENLLKIPDDYPLLGPIVDAIIEERSLGTFQKNFVLSRVSNDGNMRCTFGIAHTDTYRLNSSKNVFKEGGNLQNIPKGDRARTQLKMPNVRSFYKPPPGRELFDIDLAGADAQVVAWEARDEKLKALFRAGLKVHAVNAKDLFGGNAGPDGKAEPYYTRTKMGVHLTNYGGYPPTMAKALGITVREAEAFQNRWFDIHPEIKDWHRRVEAQLQNRLIKNAFGYERRFFGRIDRMLPTALAWVPQSTVAIIANKAMSLLDAEFEDFWLHLQVHDSLVFSLPIYRPATLVDEILAKTKIVVPYADPLIIPFGVKSSTNSWGDCG